MGSRHWERLQPGLTQRDMWVMHRPEVGGEGILVSSPGSISPCGCWNPYFLTTPVPDDMRYTKA